MLFKKIKFFALCLSVSLFCGEASATDAVEELQASLEAWREQGVDLGLTHKSDVLAVADGGLKRGLGWLGHSEARLDLDLDKLLDWNSTHLYLHYHSDLGSKFNSEHVGAVVGVDNIEVATNTAQFYQAWLQKSFIDDRLSILAGLYAIDSEFYLTQASALFIQPPYGMANEVAVSGQAGPPIFPLGALAMRVKYASHERHFYLMAAVSDGVPGNPNKPHGTQIKLGQGDGLLSIMELGYQPQHGTHDQEEKGERPWINKTAVGWWRYSAPLDVLDDATRRAHASGAYLLSEQTLWREAAQPSAGLDGFMRFGMADASTNSLDWTASMGVRYQGLIAGRHDDVAGVAVTVNHASSHQQATASKETNFEVSYQYRLRSWLVLQPTIQYILQPGLTSGIENAWLLGLRTELAI